jgi:hypothetical protein
MTFNRIPRNVARSFKPAASTLRSFMPDSQSR